MTLPANKYALPQTEKNAILFLQEWEILAKERKCKNQHKMILQLEKKNMRWRCDKSECRNAIGLRLGTFFEDK